eukprot:TRINITY_DN6864_c0_g1_i2.p1 TRINITY_DN6864_c0_g1~~TRINITY_DN6864_c0_g1_i2.p1  ORF type:complete len:550 (+),score=97.04 TRINITY_DN6864_c0_g1_i2:302-1951(+)
MITRKSGMITFPSSMKNAIRLNHVFKRGFHLDAQKLGINFDNIVVTGVSAGLPNAKDGQDKLNEDEYQRVFRKDNIERLINGESFITKLSPAQHQSMLEKNLSFVHKKDGKTSVHRLTNTNELVQVAGRLNFDMQKEFPSITPQLLETLDISYQLAIGAGIEALRDANLIENNNESYKIPSSMSKETGVIMGACYPIIDGVIDELSRYMEKKYKGLSSELISKHFTKIVDGIENDEIKKNALEWLEENKPNIENQYQYNRKFLFKVTVLGNTQLAQLIGASGPNTMINSACSSTTQAVGIGEDWIRMGRAKRVIVVTGDDVTSKHLLPWVGAGFLVAGAATQGNLSLPFDESRKGLVLGVGAIGLVIEAETNAKERNAKPLARLLGTHFANSAGHGVRIDGKHIAQELETFIQSIERKYSLTREKIATQLIYLAHETCTNSSSEASCAGAEIFALKHVFGDLTSKIIVAATKGSTGHAMGVSFEEPVGVRMLQKGIIPPILNFRKLDPYLGNITLSQGGSHDRKFVLRFAGGFGSQVAFSFYGKYDQSY